MQGQRSEWRQCAENMPDICSMKRVGEIIIVIIVKGVIPAGSSQRYYVAAGGHEKRKDRKTQNSRSEEKVVGFNSASLFPPRKREVVTQGETMEPGG